MFLRLPLPAGITSQAGLFIIKIKDDKVLFFDILRMGRAAQGFCRVVMDIDAKGLLRFNEKSVPAVSTRTGTLIPACLSSTPSTG